MLHTIFPTSFLSFLSVGVFRYLKTILSMTGTLKAHLSLCASLPNSFLLLKTSERRGKLIPSLSAEPPPRRWPSCGLAQSVPPPARALGRSRGCPVSTWRVTGIRRWDRQIGSPNGYLYNTITWDWKICPISWGGRPGVNIGIYFIHWSVWI